jgi:hypothetical protein
MGPLYRAAAANDQWGRVFFRKKHILPLYGAPAANDQWGRSVGLPQPMTSGVVYLFRENHILPLCGASAANDRWGRLFI